MNELEELNLLNQLIELGAKAAHAHTQSNSDDGHKGTAAYVQWHELRAEMGELVRAAYAPQADSVTAPAYSIDADPQGIRARVAEAITGALAFGARGANPPPPGHWLAPFWKSARQEASRNAPVTSDTLYLLRRLLSNQHTLTSSEFREELGKIVGEATQAADSVEHATRRWAAPKYDHQQREWCIAYEAETGFDPMMDDYEAGLKTFAEAAVASLRWYEDHTSDAHLRISNKAIPGGRYDAARKQGGA